MDQQLQQKFQEKLRELLSMAKKKKNVLEYQEVNDFFSDMELNEDQINTINTILFNNYRRFRRSVSTVEEDEPIVLKNFSSFSKSIQNVFDKSYGDVHTISFLLRIKDMKKDEELDIGYLKNSTDLFFQAGGTGLLRSEPLPGYFYK